MSETKNRCSHPDLHISERLTGIFCWQKDVDGTIFHLDDDVEHTGHFQFRCKGCGMKRNYYIHGRQAKNYPKWVKSALKVVTHGFFDE